MEQFLPIQGLTGGLLIGLAGTLFVVVEGRVAGISGIVGDLMRPSTGDVGWRIAFVVGLVAGPLVVLLVRGGLPPVEMVVAPPTLVLGGLLVGFGTRLGHGCTSGHGVCGLARGSRRSFVATITFFASAAVTVFLVRHVLGV